MFHFYRPQTKLCFLMCLSVHTGGGGRWGRGVSVSGQGSLSRGVSVQGGLCLGVSVYLGVCLSTGVSVSVWGSLSGGLCPGGLCPGSSLSRGSLSRGGLYLGVSVQGGFLSRGSLSGKPPYGNERAVRILLECILVSKFLSILNSKHHKIFLQSSNYWMKCHQEVFLLTSDQV